MDININRNRCWQWVFVITFLYLFTYPLRAAIPDSIDYQGYLTDDTGSPVNGTVSITFALYNVDTGGIALWSDTQSVDVTNGLFSVKLGGAGAPPAPPDLFDNPLWLGINVEGDGEMTPRIEMSSAGFAHKADDALTLEGQTAASLDQSAHVSDTSNPHSVTAAQTGAVSSSELTLHTVDPSAHHSKTTSFTELTDTATDAQIPDTITINQAVNADTLDGLDSTDFLTSVTDNWVNTMGDTMTGNLSVMADVGIGTTTPSYTLDVQGGETYYLAYINNDNNVGGASNAFGLYAAGDAYDTGNGVGAGAYFQGRGGGTNGRAYGSQNIANAYGSATAYGVYSAATGGSTTGREWAFYGFGDGYFSGDVGIGTNNPSSKLTISGGATIGSSYNTSALGNGDLAISGKLGIGTATPAHLLHIQGGVDDYLAYFHNDNNDVGLGDAQGIEIRADASDSVAGWAYGTTVYADASATNGGAYGARHFVTANGTYPAYGVYSNATGGNTADREWAFYGVGDSYFSGQVGLGTDNPYRQLEVSDSQDLVSVAMFVNNSTAGDADGVEIRIGPSDNPGTGNSFVQFRDGSGTLIGHINGNGTGGVNYISLSDARLKTKITNFIGGLDMVSRIKVKQYEFIEAPGKELIGFLAQELQTVFPQAVSGNPDSDVNKEPMGVDYGRITPVLVSAIQELMDEIQMLKAENRAMREQIRENKAALASQ